MSYQVKLSPHALRQYKKLAPAIKPQIQTALDSLQHHLPAGTKVKRLRGRLSEYYRYRMEDYRIIFTISHKERVVYVDFIDHRRQAYRDIE